MASTTLLYCRPDEIATFPLADGTLGSVSSSSIDSDYSANALVGGWPGTPTRWTVDNPSGTITLPAAGSISVVVVSHHKLAAGTTITCSSGISVVVTVPTVPPDGIPLNAFNTLTLATGVTSFQFALSGNTSDAIIGELLAGATRSLPWPVHSSDQRGLANFARDIAIEQAAVAPYDRGLSGRAPWKGKFILTEAQLADVIAWFLAQRNGTRPSVIIPDPSVNDAWVGFLQEPQWTSAGGRYLSVDLTFTELPRSRW